MASRRRRGADHVTGVGAVAAWTSPMLVIAVVAHVTAGGVEAPLFVLAALAAPLLGLLAGSGPRHARSGFVLTVTAAVVACLLGAGFRAVTDLGQVLGLETGATLGAAAALVLVMTSWPDHHRVAATALVLGAGALLVAVVALGIAVSAAPWVAWSRAATRGAFELGARSEWTGEGARFSRPVALTFAEPHQITAATATVVRVTERDREASVRERRLAAGESLMLRPGDTLAIPAGARVRFEQGRRVPGGPASGVTWADEARASGPRLLAWWIGLTVTLAGGALMVVRPGPSFSRVSAVLASVGAAAVVLAAACWGVYVVDGAPELVIDAPAAALLARLAPIVADEPWRSRVLSGLVVALVALFVGSAAALRRCLLADEVPGGTPSTRQRVLEAAIWILVIGAAAGAAAMTADGWSLIRHGAGLAAATLLGPLVATGRSPGRERARAIGAVTGAGVFIALSALARWPGLSPSVDAVAPYPALVAAPAAWLVARLTPATSAGGGARQRPGDARKHPGDARKRPGDARKRPGDARKRPGGAKPAAELQ